MEVVREQFLRDGYLIVRNVIPPEDLDPVRRAYEVMVDRQRAIWRKKRAPDAPPGGVWETGAQPRLALHSMGDFVDGETALAIDLWLRETTHGVSSKLLGVEDAGVTEMMLMCSPVRDHGPARWHRDFNPSYCAPLEGYVGDIVEGGPRYVQWNIPLYDDNVLWVVPGSHIRCNSDEENRQLLENYAAPLSSGVQTELNAGDGVAYILPILHWGSNYSTKMRRTVHGGFSMFSINPDLRFLDHVAESTREAFERWRERSTATLMRTADVLRAALEKDAGEYQAALDRLHPGRGPKGKLQSTVFLSKATRRIKDLKDPDFSNLPQQVQSSATSVHPMTLQWGTPIAELFTATEAAELWDRYRWMDEALHADREQSEPGFQGKPSLYHQNSLPAEVSLERFTDW